VIERTCLPLRWHAAETGRDAEEDTVVFGQGLRSRNGVVGLGSSIHLGEDLLGKSLRHPREILAIASSPVQSE
jgi:hypothetical protein